MLNFYYRTKKTLQSICCFVYERKVIKAPGQALQKFLKFLFVNHSDVTRRNGQVVSRQFKPLQKKEQMRTKTINGIRKVCNARCFSREIYLRSLFTFPAPKKLVKIYRKTFFLLSPVSRRKKTVSGRKLCNVEHEKHRGRKEIFVGRKLSQRTSFFLMSCFTTNAGGC